MSTRELAEGLHAVSLTGAPQELRDVGRRALLWALASAVAAAPREEVDLLVRHAQAVGATGPCPVPGRSERLDVQSAALVVGFAARLSAVGSRPVAPGGPGAVAVAAAVPLLARPGVGPDRLLDALVLGMEAQLRVGLAMAPDHEERGWDSAGTVGPLGAAVTAGVLLGLDAGQLRHAVAIATSTVLGHAEGFGTPLQAFHPGKAAANGLLAAFLAARGFTGADAALEGRRGYFHGIAPEADVQALVRGLGTTWVLLGDTGLPGADQVRDSHVVRLEDPELERSAADLLDRTRPARGTNLVRTVTALPEQQDCSSLLSATSPETT